MASELLEVGPWAVGTDANDVLKSFIEAQLAAPKFKGRLPRQHLKVIKEGRRERAGITIRIVSEAVNKRPRVYPVGNGQNANARWMRVGVFVKADQKSNGAASVEAVHGLLEEMFLPYKESPELAALIQAGLYMLEPSTEGFVADPDGNEDEAVFASKELQLRFCTATYVA